METFSIDINAEVDCFFDDSSLAHDEPPRLVVLMGGVAVGKTTMRKDSYSTGHVLVDAAEIFLRLSRGKFYAFPEAFEVPMEMIGTLVARRAVAEKRHIVTEIIGAEQAPLDALLQGMKGRGYKVHLALLTCDLEEAQRRNLSRGDESISAYYAEPFQLKWLESAAT